LKKLYADIYVVSVEAGKVIVLANHRIGVELAKLPPAKGAAEKGTKRAGPGGKVTRASEKPTLKESVGSKTRGKRLKKLGSTPKDAINKAVDKLAEEGKDVNVKEVAAAAAQPIRSGTGVPYTQGCMHL